MVASCLSPAPIPMRVCLIRGDETFCYSGGQRRLIGRKHLGALIHIILKL